MRTLGILIKRNTKLFFRDKGMFFTSLITPAILLLLYTTFLGKVYRDAFGASLPAGIAVPDSLIDGYVGGQLVSSLLAVSCVTVAFCANMLMVQDKANGTIKDLTIAPVRRWQLALGYYAASFLSTLLVCLFATALCLLYVAAVGWYMSMADILWMLLDVFLLTLFGTALSSIVNHFLSTQGQISAVGAIVSSAYGFICGAYMPISQFSEGLQKVISFLPGTYGTSLIRNHAMRGAFAELTALGIPQEAVDGIRDSIDCHLYFFDRPVSIPDMYAILCITIMVLVGLYILLNSLRRKVH